MRAPLDSRRVAFGALARPDSRRVAFGALARPSLVAASVLALASCFGGGPRLLDPEDAGSATPVDFADVSAIDASTDVDLGDPFAVLGLQPAHGPWTGGTRTVIRGRGFTSKMSIYVGGKAVDPTAIVASDPTRVAIVTPEGTPGPADVTVKNETTADTRTLAAGFNYDAFVVKPNTGAQTGGTRVRIEGRGTAFVSGVSVGFGNAPCADVKVESPTALECTTPAGAIGPVEVLVKTPFAADLPARDAFTYTDLFDPSRGGLSGGALSGALRVNVLNGATGLPIPGAKVIAGESLASAIVGTTAANGSANLANPSLTNKVTVTAAAKCHQPMTYVDVPVDTVTVYLDPIIDLSCIELEDPPSSGGRGNRNGGIIEGELVWPGGVEFKRGSWDNVPLPVRASERLAAYVFMATSATQASFSLPAVTSATTPQSQGGQGYAYNLVAPPGNVTLYALAGIEDRSVSPPKFSAFAMGVARGVAVAPNVATSGVDIVMDVFVDKALALSTQPPPITARGPDRLVANMAVSVGSNAYAILPESTQTRLLPFPGSLTFAPVPSLDGALAGEAYVVGATAVTSVNQSAPASVVAKVRVTNANAPVTLGGFLPVPSMVSPGTGAFSGTRVEVGTQGAFDLLQLVISSGNGLTSWTVIAPAGRSSFDLPDLSTLPDNVGLKRGPILSTAYVARLDASFSYATLRSGDLSSAKWSAYAWDAVAGSY